MSCKEFSLIVAGRANLISRQMIPTRIRIFALVSHYQMFKPETIRWKRYDRQVNCTMTSSNLHYVMRLQHNDNIMINSISHVQLVFELNQSKQCHRFDIFMKV